MILANGSEVETDLYTAVVVIGGEVRNVLIEAAETEPLIGMALLEHHRLTIDVVENGSVVMQRLNA